MSVPTHPAEKPALDLPVLILNRHFQPVRITNARQGFLLLFLGRARALDSAYETFDFATWSARTPAGDERTVGTIRGPIAVPTLLVLSQYGRVPQAPLRLSRRNVFLRDAFTCQYCGIRPGQKELNLDHVMPRSRGGRSTWDNLVTSCRPCNVKKANRTPDEALMLLRTKPVRPGWSTALLIAAPEPRHPEWEPFLRDAGRA